MAALLTWDQSTERLYENGVDRGVLFVRDTDGTYPVGVAWNGVINITDSPGGGETTDLWANNRKYGTLVSPETFEGSIEAYTYPDEWAACDGSEEPIVGVSVRQQKRAVFGLAYRSKINSDAGDDIGYKIHLVYGCIAKPSETAHDTLNDSPEASTFSWDFTSTPVDVSGYRPSSKLVIDSTKVAPTVLAALEDMIYGDSASPLVTPRLPLPDEVLALT